MSGTTQQRSDDDAERRVRAILDKLDWPYEVVRCDPALADTATFCATYGYDLADSANTIVVEGRSKPPRYAACVVLATTRLDVNRTVRRRLGVKTSFAGPEVTAELTGMTLGGVTAVGLPADLPLWIDSRVIEREQIILGGGSRHWKLFTPPGLLTLLPNAEVVEGLATDPPAAEA